MDGQGLAPVAGGDAVGDRGDARGQIDAGGQPQSKQAAMDPDHIRRPGDGRQGQPHTRTRQGNHPAVAHAAGQMPRAEQGQKIAAGKHQKKMSGTAVIQLQVPADDGQKRGHNDPCHEVQEKDARQQQDGRQRGSEVIVRLVFSRHRTGFGLLGHTYPSHGADAGNQRGVMPAIHPQPP